MIVAWIALAVAFPGGILGLILLGKHFDDSEDPKTVEVKKQVGEWLSGKEAHTLKTRLQETNQTFLDIFDRLFSGKGSIIEQSIWTGLLLTPVLLWMFQAPTLVGVESAFPGAVDSLIVAVVTAFSVSSGVVIGRSIMDRFGGHRILMLFTILIISVFVISVVMVTDIGIGTFIYLGIVAGIAIGMVSVIDGVISNVIGISVGLKVSYRASRFVHSINILSIHPLKVVGSSVAFIIVIGIILSLIRADSATSFIAEMRNGEGPKILAFVAFNIFADGISLLETRWVLQRGGSATILQLLGLVVVDLVLSALIFLFLPAVVGEFSAMREAVFLQGDRPWLGILFWSTFGTSALFYVFVAAVFLFLLPGHGIARAFRGVIGGLRDYRGAALHFARVCLVRPMCVGCNSNGDRCGGNYFWLRSPALTRALAKSQLVQWEPSY